MGAGLGAERSIKTLKDHVKKQNRGLRNGGMFQNVIVDHTSYHRVHTESPFQHINFRYTALATRKQKTPEQRKTQIFQGCVRFAAVVIDRMFCLEFTDLRNISTFSSLLLLLLFIFPRKRGKSGQTRLKKIYWPLLYTVTKYRIHVFWGIHQVYYSIRVNQSTHPTKCALKHLPHTYVPRTRYDQLYMRGKCTAVNKIVVQ